MRFAAVELFVLLAGKKCVAEYVNKLNFVTSVIYFSSIMLPTTCGSEQWLTALCSRRLVGAAASLLVGEEQLMIRAMRSKTKEESRPSSGDSPRSGRGDVGTFDR